MGTRTVRLDKETESTLQHLRKTTGLSISEVLKRGVLAYSEQAGSHVDASPYAIFSRIDLGAGGDALAPARDTKAALRAAIARKHRR